MLKLNDLKASLTMSYEVVHPVSGPTGWVLTLAGDGHPTTKAALRKLLDTRAKRKVSTPEQTEADANELLASRTLGWSGLEDLPYSPEAVLQVYQDETLSWAKRQVLEALGDDALFFVK